MIDLDPQHWRFIPRLEHGPRVRSRHRSPGFEVNAIIAGSSGVVAAGTALLIFSQIEYHDPKGTWPFVLGVALFIVGLAGFFGAAIVTVQRSFAARRTPFELIHDASDPQCVQVTEYAPGHITTIALRVKVRNIGREGLNNVKARMIKTDAFDHWLRIRHDNTSPFAQSLAGATVPPDPTYWTYFDVATVYGEGSIGIEYADDGLKGMSVRKDPIQRFHIEIWGSREVGGRTVEPQRKRMCIYKPNGWPELHMLDD